MKMKRAFSNKIKNLEKMEDGFNKGYFDLISNDDNMVRYKIGIIDFLTNYDNSKFVENQLKSKVGRVNSNQISAIDAVSYQQRFIKFM
jgi:hypothetical protein